MSTKERTSGKLLCNRSQWERAEQDIPFCLLLLCLCKCSNLASGSGAIGGVLRLCWTCILKNARWLKRTSKLRKWNVIEQSSFFCFAFLCLSLSFSLSRWYFVVIPFLSLSLSSPLSLQGGWILVLAPDPMWKLVTHIPQQFTLLWESQALLHLRWREWEVLRDNCKIDRRVGWSYFWQKRVGMRKRAIF